MDHLRSIFYFFTPYTDVRERTVARFFRRLDERSKPAKTRATLDKLMQHDIAAINLWTEHRYKGYTYLTKTERKKLYANLDRIVEDFDRFYQRTRSQAGSEKLELLRTLTDYFSPRHGRYEYRDSSSFGRLLRDPTHEKLVGDCNQIVTLYLYIYSRYFNLHDLRVRVLPEHVALHFEGVDIETTNGTFVDYSQRTDSELLPIEEIVSINLLDTTDAYLTTHEVAAEDLLQASRLAFILSHNRDIVTRNLAIAYRKVATTLMQRSNYGQALKIAQASKDGALVQIVGHNGAIYEIEHHNFAAARHFAQYAEQQTELVRASWSAEGTYHYKAHRYHDAINAFKHAGNQTAVGQAYEALFFEEQKKLPSQLNTQAIKQHAGTIRRMQNYAQKSGNKKLIRHTNDLSKHLR